MTRKIYIIDEVNDEMYKRFTEELDAILDDDNKLPIHIEIKSEGGSPYVALAIYGRLRSCPVQTIGTVYGCALSAATLIIAGCDIRRAQEDAWFMFHESEEKITGGAAFLVKKAKQSDLEEEQWAALLSQSSGAPMNTWLDLSRKTTYLRAAEVKYLGLIDEVLKGKQRAKGKKRA